MRKSIQYGLGPILSVCLGLSGQSALAEESTSGAATTTSGESAMILGEVVVETAKGGPLPTTSVLSSVDILGAEMIEHQNVQNSWELYNQIPGVQTTEFRMGAWSGKPSFRGFNGEGEINAVKLLIDGIPSNSNDGNMPYMDMVFPLDIDAIEVVRGTNDPRYGLHNIAGNTNIQTKTGGNYTQARVGYGSFDSREAQVSQGIETDTVSQNYFLAWRDSQGYRDHADSEKYTMAGKWFLTPNAGRYRLGLIARHYENTADEAGYLTAAQAAQTPRRSMSHNSTDGGERAMSQVSGHLDATLTDQLSLSAKTYSNSFDDERWVTFSSRVAQQERVSQEHHTGALSSMTWRPGGVPVVHSLALEGGVSIEHQDNESLRYTTVNRQRTAVTRNQKYDLDVTGGYVQAVVEPVSQLKVIPAWRVDSISGSYQNQVNGQSYAVNDYGTINQPKISVVYTPVENYSLYGNWGRTFQIGVGTAAYKVGQTEDLEPSINDGWEAGLKFRPTRWMDGRVAVWEQVASNEARRKLNDPNNASENIGKTKRNGLDVEVSMTPVDRWRVWGGYAWQTSEILRADAASPTTLGKEIDHIPHHLFSGGVDYTPTAEWTLSLLSHGQSDYYLDRTNSTQKYGDYVLFDASAVYQFNEKVSLDFQVKNLTNAYYEYVWHDGTETLHSPGDGISFFTAVNLKL